MECGTLEGKWLARVEANIEQYEETLVVWHAGELGACKIQETVTPFTKIRNLLTDYNASPHLGTRATVKRGMAFMKDSSSL